MKRVGIGIALLLCILPAVGKGQPACLHTLKLTFVETHNFSPVYPAVVYFDELHRSLETDESGVIILDSLCEGSYTLHVHGAGFKEKTETIVVNGSASLRIKVDYEDHSLHEITVTGERTQTLLQSKDVLNSSQLQAASGKTLADMLQSLSGVTVVGNGATISKPVIHGMSGNRIVMLNNGIRQEDQQWGGEHAPNIDPFLANSVTVLKGAASVRYGMDAIAGVVLVEPEPISAEKGWAGAVNLAGFSNNRMGVASAMAEHTFKKVPSLGFRVQGTFKKGGNYRIPGHWVANTGVEEHNSSASLVYRKLHYGGEVFYSRFNTSLGLYRGSHTGNQEDLIRAITSPDPLVASDFSYALARPRQQVQHDLVKARLYADNRYGIWNLIYGYQRNFRQEYDVLRSENGRAQLNLTLQTHTLNLNLDHKALGGFKGQIGLDGIFQDNSFADGDRLFLPGYQSAGGAVYFVERYTRDRWKAEAGLRYDHRFYGVYNHEGSSQEPVYYKYSYNNASGTAGFSYLPNDRWEWVITLANAWRAPQANELFSAGLHHGAARIELGNKELKPEKSYSASVETRFREGDRLKLDLVLYSQLINDYIYLEPGGELLTIRGYFKTFIYRQTDAWLNGADLTVQYRWAARWQSVLKASTVYAHDRKQKDWLILMPADRFSFNTRFEPSSPKRWNEPFIELSSSYVFHQNRIPENFDDIDYPRPPKGYFLLGGAIGTGVRFGQQPVYLSLSSTNLLNVQYRDYLDAFRYFIDQPGTNLVLRIRVPFNFKNNI